MTRKDYIAFAEMFARLRRMYRGRDSHLRAIRSAEVGAACIFASDNPRFDADRFHTYIADKAEEGELSTFRAAVLPEGLGRG